LTKKRALKVPFLWFGELNLISDHVAFQWNQAFHKPKTISLMIEIHKQQKRQSELRMQYSLIGELSGDVN